MRSAASGREKSCCSSGGVAVSGQDTEPSTQGPGTCNGAPSPCGPWWTLNARNLGSRQHQHPRADPSLPGPADVSTGPVEAEAPDLQLP
jgi:hypothetical protein